MVKKASIFLNMVGLDGEKIKDILAVFTDLDRIFKASYSDFKRVALLRKGDIEKILELKKTKLLDKELELIEKENIDCLDIFDEDYPPLLKEISSPPLVLYIKGERNILSNLLFAIVGTRMPTSYGISAAKDFSKKLSSLGIIIVSGLAKGIDTAAHTQAIKQGKTIAILGSGLLNIYPRENKLLAQKISKNGALISEFPLLTPPLRENFPRRNRIVSGLSMGVLIVEAALRSGALITARLACEQNREVFAIPGNINSLVSKGPHKIIKEGAKLVNCLEDILEELSVNLDNKKKELLTAAA